jgi:hypothetical protein
MITYVEEIQRMITNGIFFDNFLQILRFLSHCTATFPGQVYRKYFNRYCPKPLATASQSIRVPPDQWHAHVGNFWPMACTCWQLLTNGMHMLATSDQLHAHVGNFWPMACTSWQLLSNGMRMLATSDQWHAHVANFWPMSREIGGLATFLKLAK